MKYSKILAGNLAASIALVALSAIFTSCGNDNTPKKTDAPGVTADTLTLSVSIVPGATGMGLNAYSPNPAMITQGGTITWTNNDTVNHSATGDNAQFDSGVLVPGQSFSFTFPTVGTITYHDTVAGITSVYGSVVVTAPTIVTASPTPVPSSSPTVTASATPTPTPTPSAVPSVTPTETPVVTPTATPTATPTETPTSTPPQQQQQQQSSSTS